MRGNGKWGKLRLAGEGVHPPQEAATIRRLLMVSRQEWGMVFRDDFFQVNTEN